MSLSDSVVVMLQTMMSNGVGASVGLEAGYTQIGSAVASRLGRSFRLRRNDLRVLVGCGAAGAIGAAFNAPLTGAFYAFELIIGTYTLGTLAPVVVASILAIAVVRLILGDSAVTRSAFRPRSRQSTTSRSSALAWSARWSASRSCAA